MFGSIGFPEMMIILIVALLVFGPKKLPEIGKSVGKAIREFKKTSEEIKEKIEQEIRADEIRSVKDDVTSVLEDPYKDAKENEEGKKVP
jgi:sec-independent protein translocase protein TatA